MFISKKYLKLLIMCIIISAVYFFAAGNAIASDDNSGGGLILEDHMDDFLKTYFYSQGVEIDTASEPIYFEGDTSTLKSASGVPYIIYKKKDIKSFIMVAYFEPNQVREDFKFFKSSDGINYIQIQADAYDEGNDNGSWNRIVYSASALSNADYLKVEWGSSASTAHISKIRIGYTGGMCFSDMGFESATTSQLSTPGGWEVKYGKIESADVLNFNVSVQTSGGVPGGYLNIGENSSPSEGAVLVGQRLTLPSFFGNLDDILVEVDFQISSEVVNRSNVLRLVVLPEAYWDTLSNDNSGAALYSSGSELYSQVLHNGFIDTDDVTEWMKATTKGSDITSSLSAYTGQTVVFVLKFETWYPNELDWCKIDNFEINMGELSNSRPHFVDLKAVRDKYFGYRWAGKIVEGLKTRYDAWLNRTIELIPGSEVITSTSRFVCPTHNTSLVYEYKSYQDILATAKTYHTYYEAAEFHCNGIDPNDPSDDHTVTYGAFPADMEEITTGWYAYWFRDHAWAAYNLSYIYLAAGESNYGQKAAEIINEFAEKYPDYQLHDVVDPIRPGAARTFYYSFGEAFDFVTPVVFAIDSIYNSGQLSTSQKKAVRDDMLYPARDVQKRVAEVYNHQVVHDVAIGLIGYLYDDETVIDEAKYGYEATAENETAMGMYDELLDYGVLEDGFWFEGTLGYHGLVLKFYTYLTEAAKRNGSTDNENLYTGRTKLEAMYNAVMKIPYPDFTMQANNDGGYNPTILSGAYLWMIETADREYNSINNKYRQFLNEGYKIVSRNNADINSLLFGYAEIPGTSEPFEPIDYNLVGLGTVITRDYSDNRLMTTMDYGPPSGTHDHYDKLNVTTFGNDRVWLDDMGGILYGSVALDEYYIYTVAHNTVCVRDSSQAVLGGSFIGIGNTQSMHISAASADGMFPDVEEYKRTLLMTNPFIVDIFKLKSNQSVTFDWLAQAVDSTLTVSGVDMASTSGSLGTANGYQHVDKLYSGNTNTTWSALFSDTKIAGSSKGYKITMLNDTGMDVHIAESFGKAHESADKIPKLIASKTVNGDTEFIALHEFIDGSSQVSGFQKDGNIITVTMNDGTKYDMQYDLSHALEESSFKLLKKDVNSNILSIEVSNDNRFTIDEAQYLKSSNILSNISIVTNGDTIEITHDELDATQKLETELTFYVGSETINTIKLDSMPISYTRNGDYITITAPLKAIPVSRNKKVVLGPSDDTYAKQVEPDRVMGGYTTVIPTNGIYDHVAYIKFDLNNYTGNDITDAKLNFYAYNSSDPTGGHAILYVYGITDDTWDEDTLTWNNAPQITTESGDTRVTGTTVLIGTVSMENNNYNWNELDVTNFIKDYALNDKEASFIIYIPDNTYSDWIRIYSKEIGARAPKLVLKESKDYIAAEAAFVAGGTDAGTNYGSSTVMNVKNGVSASDDKIAYVKFDFDTYDEARVGKGILKFYVSDMSSTGQSVALNVYGITDDTWDESTITWNNSPNHESANCTITGVGTSAFKLGTVYIDEVDKYYMIDVTEFLNSRMTTKVAGFIIVDEEESSVNIEINSDEAAANKPILELYKPIRINVTAGDFIRGGSYADDNYAASTHLVVSNTPDVNNTFDRKSYIQIDLSDVDTSKVNKAVIRLRGYNSVSSTAITISAYGITDDNWTETGLTWNNAPCHSVTTGAVITDGVTAFLQDEAAVDNTVMWYEFDISDFIYSQLWGDRKVSLVLTTTQTDLSHYIDFNSDETVYPPEFILEY